MSSNIYIRDPLYGFVEVNKREQEIIDSAIFQRLNRIKQLSNTYLVYPGATHTRFEHSLGTLHLAKIIGQKLKLPSLDQEDLRIAALLHDIGHGPFSHTFEDIFRKINENNLNHEHITKYLITENPEIVSAIGPRLDSVLDILFEKDNPYHEIVSSDFDLDKMDYFRRDSYHAGVAYGHYDFDRIILTCALIEDPYSGTKHFGLEEKGMRAYESFRLARFNLWEQVYEHHTRLVADDMLIRGFSNALDEGILNEDNLNLKTCSPNGFCDYYQSLDDYSIQHEILSKSNGLAKEYIKDIRNRNLFKRAYITRADTAGIKDWGLRKKIQETPLTGIKDLENNIASQAGLTSENLIIHIQNSKIKGYMSSRIDPIPSDPFLIKMKNGKNHLLSQESPMVISDNVIRRLFVFYRGTRTEGITLQKVCEKEFDSLSMYQIE